MRNPAKIIAAERRMMAIHEAGHLVVARYLGLKSGYARIRATGADDGYTKSYIGNCRFRSAELDRLSAKRLALIAVAGLVAEHRWQEATSSDYEAEYFWD